MKRILIADTPGYLGKEINLFCRVNNRRDHGKLIFLELRDWSGLIQAVIRPDIKEYKLAKDIRAEDVLEARGEIIERPGGMKNSKIPTGGIEFKISNFKILSKAKALPIDIRGGGYDIGEESRMKYRYLDLRRPRLLKNLENRHKINLFARQELTKRGFIEVETPILTKSTPEGARDFVVPSRLQPGKFYALPQSPQQYKQLLMVSGIEKYFQIARCFRDEDPRGDRQPEFTQLDIEMSFVEEKDIMDLIEELCCGIIKSLYPQKKVDARPWKKISYKESMEKYGSDRPDLRKDKNDPDELAFVWITDFPAFEWKEAEKRWDATHHPFTRLKTENYKDIGKDPANIAAYQYDLVLNGYEIGGGSLRVYNPKELEQIFEFLGHSKKDIREKFGHLLEAFEYGVPPHGGIAMGWDRFIAILENEPNIREVIAFPKTGDSRDLMMNSPSEINEDQLKELNLEIKNKKKK